MQAHEPRDSAIFPSVVATSVEELPTVPPANPQLEDLLAEQRRRWQEGERVSLDELLAHHAVLGAQQPEEAADLIYQEFILRQELGEFPELEEYVQRFPGHAAALRA